MVKALVINLFWPLRTILSSCQYNNILNKTYARLQINQDGAIIYLLNQNI